MEAAFSLSSFLAIFFALRGFFEAHAATALRSAFLSGPEGLVGGLTASEGDAGFLLCRKGVGHVHDERVSECRGFVANGPTKLMETFR